MIIDAHLHIWNLTRAGYSWLTPEIGELYRSIDFSEIAPTLNELGIGGVVLVQAADEAEDTEFLLDAMAEHEGILGVVGWTPLDEPARVAVDAARFVEAGNVVGVRNLIHDRPPEWLDRPEVELGLEALAQAGLPWDVPTSNHHGLAPLPGIGARHPELRIIIDHLGKPPIGGTAEDRAEWRRLIAECAQNPMAVAKVSGLYAAVGAMDSWTVDSIRPFVDDALELFGPARLMYGGDWPISELAGGYHRTWDAIQTVLAGLGGEDRDAIFGGTAARIYRLDDGPR